ncbi:MAG: glycosyltransferase [Fibrobacteria bacterium]|nr:glycosyltransferase [Fibrobacteria bacterium]
MDKWIIVLPPEGAARLAGEQLIPAFNNVVGSENVKTFDSLTYRSAFTSLLKETDHNMIADLLNQSLFVQCIDFGATHVLVLALSPVTLFTLNLLKKQSIVTVHWFYEDYREAVYWRDVVSGYNHFIGIQQTEVKNVCQSNGVMFHFLPPAADLMPAMPILPAERKIADVAFIGIPSQYRINILEQLAEGGITLIIGGSQWDTYQGPLDKFIVKRGWISVKESLELQQQARAGLNLSFHDPAFSREDIHIGPRIFTILGSGLVLFTEKAPNSDAFLNDFDYFSFESVTDLVDKIKGCMHDYLNYRIICEKNRNIVLKEHNYQARTQTILSIVR